MNGVVFESFTQMASACRRRTWLGEEFNDGHTEFGVYGVLITIWLWGLGKSGLVLDKATRQRYEVGQNQKKTGEAPNSGQLLICWKSVFPMTLASVGSVQTALACPSFLPSFLSSPAVSAARALTDSRKNEESLIFLLNTVLPSGDFWR